MLNLEIGSVISKAKCPLFHSDLHHAWWLAFQRVQRVEDWQMDIMDDEFGEELKEESTLHEQIFHNNVREQIVSSFKVYLVPVPVLLLLIGEEVELVMYVAFFFSF